MKGVLNALLIFVVCTSNSYNPFHRAKLLSLPCQLDTDESLLLGSRQTHAYSWRTPHTVKGSPKLHLCIETEGDWRWSEPFDIDSVGICSRTIHHRLHSATLFIEVKQLSGMQKQVMMYDLKGGEFLPRHSENRNQRETD